MARGCFMDYVLYFQMPGSLTVTRLEEVIAPNQMTHSLP